MISTLEIPTKKKKKDRSKPIYYICPSEAISSVLIHGPRLKMLSSYFVTFHDDRFQAVTYIVTEKKRSLIPWFKFQKHCSFGQHVDLS